MSPVHVLQISPVHVLQMSPVQVLRMSPVQVLQMSPVQVLQVQSSPAFTTCLNMESEFTSIFLTHRKERFKTISLIKQPPKIIKTTFVASLTWITVDNGLLSNSQSGFQSCYTGCCKRLVEILLK